MKIRTDFVTNSSSSSFVLYKLKNKDLAELIGEGTYYNGVVCHSLSVYGDEISLEYEDPEVVDHYWEEESERYRYICSYECDGDLNELFEEISEYCINKTVTPNIKKILDGKDVYGLPAKGEYFWCGGRIGLADVIIGHDKEDDKDFLEKLFYEVVYCQEKCDINKLVSPEDMLNQILEYDIDNEKFDSDKVEEFIEEKINEFNALSEKFDELSVSRYYSVEKTESGAVFLENDKIKYKEYAEMLGEGVYCEIPHSDSSEYKRISVNGDEVVFASETDFSYNKSIYNKCYSKYKWKDTAEEKLFEKIFEEWFDFYLCTSDDIKEFLNNEDILDIPFDTLKEIFAEDSPDCWHDWECHEIEIKEYKREEFYRSVFERDADKMELDEFFSMILGGENILDGGVISFDSISEKLESIFESESDRNKFKEMTEKRRKEIDKLKEQIDDLSATRNTYYGTTD